MVPVSAAIHGAILVALIVNAARADAWPAPWPVSGVRSYVATAPPPMPRVDTSARPTPSTSAAPRQAPDRISEPVETAAAENDGPIDPFGLPPASGGVPATGWVGVPVPTPPPPAPPASEQPRLVRTGGAIREPKKISGAPPVYPEIARQARIGGLVIVEAVIDEGGFVTDARVLRSVPMLDAAALAALRQWRYTPTLLNGVPVRVLMTVTFNFQLDNRAP
jgi:protein TonB